ncbi:helix-turn-helix domain-containing protein [Bacillus sp. REN16]|uniref:helix-turn-helix domain-containing protein n=1 Tax=Bacillus sp. REN16 TaxID=2887296 RepID=UPI001E3AE5CC|nr:helix-turn-helix domain-containing protein [Bacillus sp. REN16]MCC3358966.1 helix-turn-helix domain-containing protein [Bacillus sp. REN16]
MQRNTLTVEDVAQYLGVHRDIIYTMVRQKEIPHFRVRRRIFSSLETIEQWIREQEGSIHKNSIGGNS